MEKITILFTIPNFETAGSGHALFQLALGLKNKGYNIHIMAKHDRGSLVKRILNEKIQFHVVPYESKARPLLKLFFYSFKISRIFKEIKPDIIYSYHYSSDYSEAMASFFAGIPWLYIKKNMSWYGPSQRSWYIRSFLAKKINVQNSEMESEFLFRFSKKLIHIPIGVNTDIFKPTNKNKNNQFTFIHVSTLLPIKGVHILLKAYMKLLSNFPNGHRLVILGPDKTEYIKNLKIKYSSINKISFIGKRKDVHKYLDNAHCFVQSSLNEGRREGAPIALQEAMAMELISIGSKVAGINDQLKDFDYLRYNSENPFELKEVMLRVLNMTTSERAKIGKKLRLKIINEYSLLNETDKTVNMLKTILKVK